LENEEAYRQLLVEAILAILLPTEDLENPCLTALVGQIFSELIIGNIIAKKASQPWLLYESICIASRVLGEKKTRAAQRIVSTPRKQEQGNVTGQTKVKWSTQAIFLSLVHLAVLLFSSIRTLITTLAASSSLPPRSKAAAVATTATNKLEGQRQAYDGDSHGSKVPVLAFKIWQCLGNIIELDLRMPWLSGFLSLVQYQAIYGPGKLARLNGSLDR
jgi:splicing suppressor protein 51